MGLVGRAPGYRERGCVEGCKTGTALLCGKCEEIVQKSALITGSHRLITTSKETHGHYSKHDLQISAEECSLCNLLLGLQGDETSTQHTHSSIPHLVSGDQPCLKLEVKYQSSSSSLRLRMLEEGTAWPNSLEITTDNFLHECDSSDKPNSAQTMSLARQWIKRCQTHPICENNYSPRQKKGFLPTRLLEVGKAGSPTVRLIDTYMHRRAGMVYAALSHCWGGKTPNGSLRLGTIDSMRKSITVDTLPKNFRDAIEITRGIGVPFLWIDALCIIQDSAQDWPSEAALMGLVYASSVCMISATASPDCDGGCFFQRQRPKKVTECVLGIEEGRAQIARPSEAVQNKTMDDLFDRFVEQAPLTKRGWTYQERVLAQRILHFCDGLVLFECNTLRASELHPNGIDHIIKSNLRIDGSLRGPGETGEKLFSASLEPKRITTGPTEFDRIPSASGTIMVPNLVLTPTAPNPKYKTRQAIWAEYLRSAALAGMRGEFQLLLALEGNGLRKQVGFHQSWFKIVGQYAGRSLTKASDKMFALVGVADFIEKSSGREFMAGLWVECLAINLLWNVKTASAAARAPFPAPTWSWLSVSGGVETALQLDYNDYMDPEKLLIRPLVDVVNIQTTATQERWVSNAKLKLCGRLCDFSGLRPHVIPDQTVFRLSVFGPELYLPTLEVRSGFAAETRGYQIHGLVIQCISLITNEYERVGYFTISAPDRSAACFRILESQVQEHIVLI